MKTLRIAGEGAGSGRGVTVAQNKPIRSYTNTKMRRSFINSEIRANDSENVCESNSKSIVAPREETSIFEKLLFYAKQLKQQKEPTKPQQYW